MKYLIFRSFLTLFFLSVFVVSLTTEAFAKPKFHVVFTTKYKGEHCDIEGGWCFKAGIWGDRIIRPLESGTSFSEGRTADIQVSDDGRFLYCNFTDRDNPYRLETLDAQHDLHVPEQIAEQLGYRSIVILRGNYRVDFQKNRYGFIVFEILTR